MISVSKRSVEKALSEIDRDGIARNKRSTVYCLPARGRHYAPKCVLHRAYFYEKGKRRKDLNGGPQTNKPLLKAGYKIKNCGCGNTCKISS